jgi:hypothetical protein
MNAAFAKGFENQRQQVRELVSQHAKIKGDVVADDFMVGEDSLKLGMENGALKLPMNQPAVIVAFVVEGHHHQPRDIPTGADKEGFCIDSEEFHFRSFAVLK